MGRQSSLYLSNFAPGHAAVIAYLALVSRGPDQMGRMTKFFHKAIAFENVVLDILITRARLSTHLGYTVNTSLWYI
jgi:hypothetical protein